MRSVSFCWNGGAGHGLTHKRTWIFSPGKQRNCYRNRVFLLLLKSAATEAIFLSPRKSEIQNQLYRSYIHRHGQYQYFVFQEIAYEYSKLAVAILWPLHLALYSDQITIPFLLYYATEIAPVLADSFWRRDLNLTNQSLVAGVSTCQLCQTMKIIIFVWYFFPSVWLMNSDANKWPNVILQFNGNNA